jgi:hypothetical protein
MGRGRQKAKHTKVARELKYFSPNTDYNALERELGHKTDSGEPDYEDKWADMYEDAVERSNGDDAAGSVENSTVEDSSSEAGADASDGGSAGD